MKVMDLYDIDFPKVTVGHIVYLYLAGYDDKIYMDIYDPEENLLVEHGRIISEEITAYYEKEVIAILDTCSNSTIGVMIKGD